MQIEFAIVSFSKESRQDMLLVPSSQVSMRAALLNLMYNNNALVECKSTVSMYKRAYLDVCNMALTMQSASLCYSFK